MYEQVEKTPEKKSQMEANAVSQMQNSHAPTSRFVDNRPEAIQMRKLRDLAKNSPQYTKLRELHNLAVSHPGTQKKSNGKRDFGFVDIRPEAIMQHKISDMVNSNSSSFGNKIRDIHEAGNVLQLQTSTDYSSDDYIPSTDYLIKITHQRIDMTNSHKKFARAYWIEEFGDLPSGAVCNHHIPYKYVRDQVINILVGKEVAAVANKLINVGYDIPKMINSYQREHINNAIDLFIGVLANDQRNLFYWPASSGDHGGNEIDEPHYLPLATHTYAVLKANLDDHAKDLKLYLNKLNEG